MARHGLNSQDRKIFSVRPNADRGGLKNSSASGPSRGGGASLDSSFRPCKWEETKLASELCYTHFLFWGRLRAGRRRTNT